MYRIQVDSTKSAHSHLHTYAHTSDLTLKNADLKNRTHIFGRL